MSRDTRPGLPALYAALGDSISIDDYAGGPGLGGASLFAHNRNDTFPQWRGRDLTTVHPDLRYHLLAVDGGTSETLLHHQLPQLERVGAALALVTLTIGGNDLLGAYGDTPRARRVIEVVRRRVSEALRRLQPLMQAPSSPIIVGTVYDPSDGTGDSARVGLPPWPEVVDLLTELNAELRSVAAEHDARVAEIHQRFLGHGLLRGDPAQTHPRPGDRELWYCNVIEPNAWGADGVRAAFWEALHT
jgi:lysophospholipase L1-like esterase